MWIKSDEAERLINVNPAMLTSINYDARNQSLILTYNGGSGERVPCSLADWENIKAELTKPHKQGVRDSNPHLPTWTLDGIRIKQEDTGG